MASFEKRKAGYRVSIERHGVRASRMFGTKAEAQKWADDTEAAILAGTYRAPVRGKGRPTVPKLVAVPVAHETTLDQSKLDALVRKVRALGLDCTAILLIHGNGG
ncbi:hypothetical protein [Burkholderia pseudomallei]|uniref:hypothetical protein n=1 Tax=Burkholderia pseudomallei TaxID=28450 RepID=UPI00117872C5|nr:hypothetical protein [Burkholderia pseudomallei]CAJ4971800.1 Uncharacterised protein [Burkholderia pseudomallei]